MQEMMIHVDLQVDSPPAASIGSPLTVRARVNIDKETTLLYSGITLSAIRPCDKPLTIEQREIFCKGTFKPATYERPVPIMLPQKIVPSSDRRGIRYAIRFYARVPRNHGSPAGEDEISIEKPVIINDIPDPTRLLEVNPVILAIKGLKLQLQKDIFKPGETIKINFEAKELKELKALLMQRSNIVCNCTQYGRVCTQIPVVPSSAAGAAKANNPTAGFLLLSIPKNGELSTRHEWEPKDKTTWSDKFGDYNEWYLHFSGTKYNGEDVSFDLPIEVAEGRLSTEKSPEVDFFEKSAGTIDNSPSGRALFQVKKLALKAVHRDGLNSIAITVANEGKEPHRGCTCRVTGIKDMFFETAPFMVGFGDIEPGASAVLATIPVSNGVNEVQLEFDSNDGKLGTFKRTV